MDVVQRGARERVARPRPDAFRSATTALTPPYKRWPKIEPELRIRSVHTAVFKVFSKQFWLNRDVGSYVGAIYKIYTYLKAIREGPTLCLSQK